MSKGLKVWLWVIIVANIIAIIADFILVHGNIGFLLAAVNLAVILCMVQLLKQNIIGAYVYLGLRVAEAIFVGVFSTQVYMAIPMILTALNALSIGFTAFMVGFTAFRVLASIITTIVCIKAD